MIKTTRYCDICGREQHKTYDTFYQMILPARNYMGDIILSEEESDICKECFKKLHWKISELKQHPDWKCPF